MLTGGSGGERQGLESGADAYLPKSADRDLMILRIRALLRERRAAGDGEGPGAAAFRRGRILVIDGSATYRTFLAGLMGQDGHHVATADGAEAALAALDAASGDPAFDCVTVDLLGHAYDGLALCRAISQRRSGQAAGAGFHLVGIAGSDPAKDFLVEAFAAGADDVVSKTDVEVLALRVRGFVRRRLLQDDDRRIAGQFGERERGRGARPRGSRGVRGPRPARRRPGAGQPRPRRRQRQLTDAQAKLVQAAKMASLGELVAGIAHEINNPLAFILAHQGTVERLLDQLGEMPLADGSEAAGRRRRRSSRSARQRVGSMSMGLTRIQNLVLNLRKFSRLDESEQQSVDVPDAIDTVLALLTHKLGSGITVERACTMPRAN